MTNRTVSVLLVDDSPSDAALVQESLCLDGSGRFQFTLVETLADGLLALRTVKEIKERLCHRQAQIEASAG